MRSENMIKDNKIKIEADRISKVRKSSRTQ